MRRKRENKKHRGLKILAVIVLILAILLGGAAWYVNSKLSALQKDASLNVSDEALGIDDSKMEDVDNLNDVTNIALFGLDQRSEDEAGRSDCIMVLSIDKTHKKIKMISIMRDSYVNIDGHGQDKLNHAYAFGGPQLAVKTLNENFGLNIKEYATVNFFDLEKLIDDLGGVTIDVKDSEVKYINSYMQEVAAIENSSINPVEQGGTQTLTGAQAVAYSRIRYEGDGDYERTERQRKVLEQLFNKIIKSPVSQYPALVEKLSPYITTSLSNMDMVSIGTSVVTKGITTIEKARFPYDGYFKDSGKMINGVWYLVYDIDEAGEQMRDYIYNDKLPDAASN